MMVFSPLAYNEPWPIDVVYTHRAMRGGIFWAHLRADQVGDSADVEPMATPLNHSLGGRIRLVEKFGCDPSSMSWAPDA